MDAKNTHVRCSCGGESSYCHQTVHEGEPVDRWRIECAGEPFYGGRKTCGAASGWCATLRRAVGAWNRRHKGKRVRRTKAVR